MADENRYRRHTIFSKEYRDFSDVSKHRYLLSGPDVYRFDDENGSEKNLITVGGVDIRKKFYDAPQRKMGLKKCCGVLFTKTSASISIPNDSGTVYSKIYVYENGELVSLLSKGNSYTFISSTSFKYAIIYTNSPATHLRFYTGPETLCIVYSKIRFIVNPLIGRGGTMCQTYYENKRNMEIFRTYATIPADIIVPEGSTFYGLCNDFYYNIKTVYKGDIYLPESLRRFGIGCAAVIRVASGKRIIFAGSVEDWGRVNIANNNSNYHMNILSGFKKIYFNNDSSTLHTEIKYHPGISVIYAENYAGGNQFTKLTIPATVTNIYHSAFYDTTLEEIYYEGTIEQYQQITWTNNNYFPYFFGTRSRYDLYCKDSLTNEYYKVTELTLLNERALFESSKSFSTVIIPTSTTSVRSNAFYNSADIALVRYEGALIDWLRISFGNSSSNPTMISHNLEIGGELVTDIIVPNEITALKTATFRGLILNSITLHEGITSIGSFAFANVTTKMEATLPKSVTSIGTGAFYNSSVFQTIAIPKVTSLGAITFVMCNAKKIMIPSTLTSFNSSFYDQGTFGSMPNLQLFIWNCASNLTGNHQYTTKRQIKYLDFRRGYETNFYSGFYSGTKWGVLDCKLIFVLRDKSSFQISYNLSNETNSFPIYIFVHPEMESTYLNNAKTNRCNIRTFTEMFEYNSSEVPSDGAYRFDSNNHVLYLYNAQSESYNVVTPSDNTFWYNETEYIEDYENGNKLWMYTTANGWYCITDNVIV